MAQAEGCCRAWGPRGGGVVGPPAEVRVQFRELSST